MRARTPLLLSLAPSVIVAVAAGADGAVASRLAGRDSAASRPAAACRPWHARRILSGQAWLESLAFDGHGAMTISALAQGKILRLTPSGRLSVLLSGVPAPGAQVVRGHSLYFTTGDTVTSTANGTIARYDLVTHRRTVWARGLAMPNGLAFLPGGDAVVTRDLEAPPPPATDITRISARTRRAHVNWARVPDGNGLAVDPTGRWLYTDRTFSADGRVLRIRIAHPGQIRVVARLGAGVAPDDMAIDPAGRLYIAGFASGKVYRLDPRTGAVCALARGLGSPTAAVFGGRGFHPADLYVTTAGGDVYQLSSPGRTG